MTRASKRQNFHFRMNYLFTVENRFPGLWLLDLCHVCWNVAGTVSQMRQRLCHRGPAVPKSITPTMERCSGNAQCPTMDTNCWLTWKLSSTLIYNLTSKVLQWPLCVHMTTGKREKIWVPTIVVVLLCMHAHHAFFWWILKNNYTNVTALLKISFACHKFTALLQILEVRRW